MNSILVVDDNLELLKTMKTILKNSFEEHRVITTTSSEEGLEMISEEYETDLIFFNSLNSDTPNGLEFAKQCRENNPYVIMVYMSENLDTQKLNKLSSIGIDMFLKKDHIESDFITTIVNNAITRHQHLLNNKTPQHKELEAKVDEMIERLQARLPERPEDNEDQQSLWDKIKNWFTFNEQEESN